MSLLDKFLMKISPHDEERMEQSIEETRERIEDRERDRVTVQKKSRDYIEMQLQIMRHK